MPDHGRNDLEPFVEEVSEPEVRNTAPLDKTKLLLPASILIAAVLISGSVLYARSGISQKLVAGQFAAQQQAGDQPSGPIKISIDNDAVLGDKNAPLTLIEFADYECPFCKRSFDQLFPDLKKNYIDTGKLKLVYRDFPLSFHANAQKEAEAAECARSQGDDTTYFKFHDQIYSKTKANGTGLPLSQLPIMAKSLGLNVAQFQRCLDSGEFKDEVVKDMADGTAAGVTGTPSWIVGKSSADGVIEGSLIVGAQPFSAFKIIIDQLLAK